MCEFFAGLIHTERVQPRPAEAKVPGIRYAIVDRYNPLPSAVYQSVKNTQSVEWDVAPLPAWKPTGKKATPAGDTPNLVTKAAQRNNHLAEVVQFLFYMQGEVAGRALAANPSAPGIPTKKTVAQSDEFLKKKPPLHVERVQDSFDSKNMFVQYPLFARSGQWRSAIDPLWDKVLSGDLSPRAFAQQADVAANAALAAPISF